MRTRCALVLLCLLCLFALRGDAADQLRVTVTAYSSGTRTASGTRPRVGMIALSRDVERALGVAFGDRVTLAGLGTYTYQDRMPGYWRTRVDVYRGSRRQAVQFGKRHALLARAPWIESRAGPTE